MNDAERRKLAFDFARDCAKQLITLSTAIVTLTITFSNGLLQTVSDWTWMILGLAWFTYFVSIGGGLLHLFAMTEALEPPPDQALVPASIRSPLSLRAALVQQVAFAVATALVIIFGIASVWDTDSAAPEPLAAIATSAASSVPAPSR